MCGYDSTNLLKWQQYGLVLGASYNKGRYEKRGCVVPVKRYFFQR